DEMASAGFRAADSDTRFQRLFDRLSASARRSGGRAQAQVPRRIAGAGGQAIAELARAGRGARLTIPESAGDGFADYVAARLPDLHAAYVSGAKGGGKGEE